MSKIWTKYSSHRPTTKGLLYFVWIQRLTPTRIDSPSTGLPALQHYVVPWNNLIQVCYTLQTQELLFDGTPWPLERCDLVPYISLAADICEIKSKVLFPNLGSMTHSKASGWLCDFRKKRWEGSKALKVLVSYEIRPEVNLGSPITPLLEIWKQAVIDATASHMFISANVLPGHILACKYQNWVACVAADLDRRTDVQSQKSVALDQEACRRWSALDEKIRAHHISQGS